jgi:PadR family transcriptional regulator PadR
MNNHVDLLQGTLEILILKAVSLGPLHGYGILMRIQQISGGRLQIPQGSFYIAVYRIEHKGWLKGVWGESENNRRAKFYRLTPAGRRQLESETQKWSEMTDVIHGILSATAETI